MGLVGDGIEYINPDRKNDGYRVVEGEKNAPLLIPNVERRGRKKKSKNRVEYTEDAIRVGASSRIPTYYDKVKLWSSFYL